MPLEAEKLVAHGICIGDNSPRRPHPRPPPSPPPSPPPPSPPPHCSVPLQLYDDGNEYANLARVSYITFACWPEFDDPSSPRLEDVAFTPVPQGTRFVGGEGGQFDSIVGRRHTSTFYRFGSEPEDQFWLPSFPLEKFATYALRTHDFNMTELQFPGTCNSSDASAFPPFSADGWQWYTFPICEATPISELPVAISDETSLQISEYPKAQGPLGADQTLYPTTGWWGTTCRDLGNTIGFRTTSEPARYVQSLADYQSTCNDFSQGAPCVCVLQPNNGWRWLNAVRAPSPPAPPAPPLSAANACTTHRCETVGSATFVKIMATDGPYRKTSAAQGDLATDKTAKLSDAQINELRDVAERVGGQHVYRLKSTAATKYAWFRTNGTWVDAARVFGQDVAHGYQALTPTSELPSTWSAVPARYSQYYLNFDFLDSGLPTSVHTSANWYLLGHPDSNRDDSYFGCFDQYDFNAPHTEAEWMSTGPNGGEFRCFASGRGDSHWRFSFAPLPEVEVWMLLSRE